MKKLKILIADDEEMLRDLYEMILESEFECESVKVANGLEAISVLESNNQFDVIISDYNMPKATGDKIYLFNKAHANIPFFLFSGGELQDYQDFNDFHEANPLNHFFNKPFSDELFINAITKVLDKPTKIEPVESQTTEIDQYIKVKLAYYYQHTKNAAEVYIKLNENKYTKIINAHVDNIPDTDLLAHYLNKGIDTIYLEKDYFKLFLNDIFSKFQENILSEKKPETKFQLAGLNFNVSAEGLNDIGISTFQISRVNEVIEETIYSLLNNASTKNQFIKLCESEGFIIGHSILIMYIAGRIGKETDLNFASLMKKMSMAAFYHDFSLFDLDLEHEQMKHNELSELKNTSQSKKIIDHPVTSACFLPSNLEVVDDIKKIISEHHELPNGDGYPKKLTASQIAPLSCLFILSQQIAFCLMRNDYSPERLKDFLISIEPNYNQGNFSQFYKIAKSIF